MKENRILQIVLMLLGLAIGGVIVAYYWMNNSFESVTYVPVYMMILAFCYVLTQISKRYFFKNQNWWDWLYYIGLIAMMLPNFFVNEAYSEIYNTLTDVGTLFLVIPILLDGKQIINGK
jgi:hypothetical protein